MRFFFCLLILLLNNILFSQNSAPHIIINDVQVDEVNEVLEINYELIDAENEDCEISLFVSENNGRTFPIEVNDASGDIGFSVSPGTAKTIFWDFTDKLSSDVNLKFKLIADDKFEIKIEEIIAKVDSNRLRGYLEFLEGVRHRSAGATHLQVTKDSIESAFINAGLKTEVFNFMRGNYKAENFLGTLQGTSESNEYFLVGGHYDTVDDSPGADDNGSAIAGMMEALEILKDYNFKKTIKFVGFDLEEEGTVGSMNFVGNNLPDDELLLGFLDFEMIGYYSSAPNSQTLPTGFEILFPEAAAQVSGDANRGNFLTVVGNQTHETLADSFSAISGKYVPELKTVKVVSPGVGTLVPDLLRSDHAPFWLAGLPSLMLTDGANFRNPFYHTPNDKVETLNFTFMQNVVKATISVMAKLAKPVHVGSASAVFSDLVSADEISESGIAVYPNPVKNILNIDIRNSLFTPRQLKLISLSGELVFQKKVENRKTISVSAESLNKGVYLLQMIDNQGVITKKVIIH